MQVVASLLRPEVLSLAYYVCDHRFIDADMILSAMQSHNALLINRVTPKLFQYSMRQACMKSPQRIVLPESDDHRVLQAAAEVTQRGLAKIILLGKPEVGCPGQRACITRANSHFFSRSGG